MTKKQIFEEVMNLCKDYKASKEFTEKLKELLEPKRGGGRIKLEEVTKTDKNGKITHILDTVSGLWFPVNPDVIYTDKHQKGIEVDGVFYTRVAKCADRTKKAHKRKIQASKDALMADVLAGNITPDEAKAKLAKIENEPVDYSECLKIPGVLKA